MRKISAVLLHKSIKNLYKLINVSVINKFKNASAVAANEIKKIPGRVKKLIRISDLVTLLLFSLTKVAKL